MKMKSPAIVGRVNYLKTKAAERFRTSPEKCHIGHVALQALLEEPYKMHQIDGAKGQQETNLSMALRSMRVANAMERLGLKPGDPVILMGHNHLDLAVPYFACHYNGYSMCSVDPSIQAEDVKLLYPFINPKMIFCQKDCVEKNKKALQANNIKAHIVTFDDKENDLESLIQIYKGTELDFRPAEFDTSKIAAWLILTSGTTGVPKVAIIPFDTLLNGVIEWWTVVEDDVSKNMIMTSTQWLSSLIFFISTPIKSFTRLQSSQPITPQLLVHMINKYRPDVTAWTPYLLARFVQSAEKVCDLSCFKHILIGGAAMEKPIVESFRKICPARLYLSYGMTELLCVLFDYNQDDTPFGSSGKAMDKYLYRLVGDNGEVIEENFKNGELWVKGDAFFKGYLNNPEETEKVLTEDGWLKTGDIFYRDDNNYYFFVERKKALIKYFGNFVSPLQIEEVIKQHPGVLEACVFALPDPNTLEVAVAAIMKKNDAELDPQEIFDLVRKNLTEPKHLHGGLIFVDSFPTTPSGKVNRSKLVQIAINSKRIMPKPKEAIS